MSIAISYLFLEGILILIMEDSWISVLERRNSSDELTNSTEDLTEIHPVDFFSGNWNHLKECDDFSKNLLAISIFFNIQA